MYSTYKPFKCLCCTMCSYVQVHNCHWTPLLKYFMDHIRGKFEEQGYTAWNISKAINKFLAVLLE